jgi:single stranded DNA-binding protein (ssb)
MIILEIAGHLGKDPESRFTPSGQKLTTMTVATNVRKAGKDETVWWRVVIWGERFDKILPYFKKGSAIIVVGEMNKPELWTDKEGRTQVSLEMTAEIIRFSPFGKPDSSGHERVASVQSSPSQSGAFGGDAGMPDYGNQPSSSGASHASPSGYGAAPAAAAPRYTQPAQSEDPLPF